jgi:hypothetical protein
MSDLLPYGFPTKILYAFFMLSGSVTMAWHILWLQMEESLQIWREAANVLNKQLWTADKG